jgi:hypothetical protein
MTADKKVWEKPELLVLVRTKPEEAVLTGCKTFNAQGSSGDACASELGWCEAESVS